MTCGCPDAVVYALRQIVSAELGKLRAIVRASQFFDKAVGDVIGIVGGEIDTAVSAIPGPVSLSFPDLLEYLTCPLLPLALGLGITDIEDLDPTTQLQKLKALKSSEIERARENFEAALSGSVNANLIAMARKYTAELLRLRFDATSFARAVLITATVLSVCGEEEYQTGPYQEFANLLQGFSMPGGVPSTLSNNSAAITQKLLTAEGKFKALRASVA